MARTARGHGTSTTSVAGRSGSHVRLAARIAAAALASTAAVGLVSATTATATTTTVKAATATRVAAQKYTTKAGDTLAKVATHFGLSWRNLARDNRNVVGDHPRPNRRLPVGTVLTIAATVPPPVGRTFTAYVTGYTWFDNTPPGSAEISNPVLHQTADGTGTYADPITVAVGHDLSSGRDVLDYAAGTRFYLPYLKRYFLVEDTCGDGPKPQNGACHRHASNVSAWLDIWIDGEGGTASSADSCASRITRNTTVEINPPTGRLVTSGSVASGGHCAL
ncbi:MAG: LysM domain-containing protein [Frankiaceae bacterium]